MRERMLFLILFFGMAAIGWPFQSGGADEMGGDAISDKFNLVTCGDDTIGVKFLCNPDWDIHAEQNAIQMIVSNEPIITATILKGKTKLVSLEQLTKEVFMRQDRYEEGFQIERVIIAGRDALLVKGFSNIDPDTRYSDYYVIKNKFLYSFLFSLRPKSQWGRFKFLIKKVSDSISFLKYSDLHQPFFSQHY